MAYKKAVSKREEKEKNLQELSDEQNQNEQSENDNDNDNKNNKSTTDTKTKDFSNEELIALSKDPEWSAVKTLAESYFSRRGETFCSK